VSEIRTATAALAARQAIWIAALEPWKSLGYEARGLSRFLRRMADSRGVLVAVEAAPRGRERVAGVLALQEGVLLGNFVSLLAVRDDAAGRGLGRALIEAAQARTLPRRWLFVSADAGNRGALAFYRKLGFTRVGRLPDLVRAGRVELLLRKPVPRPS
jgi:ribosomal protein S18 acetylase RimI-like enzyme